MGTALLWEKFNHQGVYWDTPHHSKEQRLYEILPLFHEGRVLFPPKTFMHKNLLALKRELLTAPHSKTDDLLDALVLALRGLVHFKIQNRSPIDYRELSPSLNFWKEKNAKK